MNKLKINNIKKGERDIKFLILNFTEKDVKEDLLNSILFLRMNK